MAAILSSEERTCYRLYHQTPGLTQKAIAEKLGVNQGQVSRYLESARAKVAELKQLCSDSGGDVDVVEQYLARLDAGVQTGPLAHSA